MYNTTGLLMAHSKSNHTVEPVDIAPFCKVCDRVPFGAVVRLQAGSWRHEDCYFGSEAWWEYYKAMPNGPGKDNLTELARCLVGVSRSVVSNNQEGV
jgi:hypothetical protein